MSGASPLDTVRGIYRSFGQGDIPSLLSALAEDVDWRWNGPPSIPFAGHHRGREAVGAFFAKVGETVEVERYEPEEFIAGDGGVVTVLGWQRVRARATGRVWESPFAHIFTVRDGKIGRAREFYDSAAIAAAFEERAGVAS